MGPAGEVLDRRESLVCVGPFTAPAEAEKAGMDISPVSGEEAQKVADSIANTEAAVLTRAKAILDN